MQKNNTKDAVNLEIIDTGQSQSSIINVALPEKQAQAIQHFLRNGTINTSISSHMPKSILEQRN